MTGPNGFSYVEEQMLKLRGRKSGADRLSCTGGVTGAV